MPPTRPTLNYDTPPAGETSRRTVGRGLAFSLFAESTGVCALSFAGVFDGLGPLKGEVDRFLFIASGPSAVLFGADFVAAGWA